LTSASLRTNFTSIGFFGPNIAIPAGVSRGKQVLTVSQPGFVATIHASHKMEVAFPYFWNTFVSLLTTLHHSREKMWEDVKSQARKVGIQTARRSSMGVTHFGFGKGIGIGTLRLLYLL
jgi:hypothetical protein